MSAPTLPAVLSPSPLEHESCEEAKHRRALEKKALAAMIEDQRRRHEFMRLALWLTLIVVLFGITASVILGLHGCHLEAGVVGGGSLVAFTTFLRLALSSAPPSARGGS
jgi:predicted anti-sigma-YlaC factor YlaD